MFVYRFIRVTHRPWTISFRDYPSQTVTSFLRIHTHAIVLRYRYRFSCRYRSVFNVPRSFKISTTPTWLGFRFVRIFRENREN